MGLKSVSSLPSITLYSTNQPSSFRSQHLVSRSGGSSPVKQLSPSTTPPPTSPAAAKRLSWNLDDVKFSASTDDLIRSYLTDLHLSPSGGSGSSSSWASTCVGAVALSPLSPPPAPPLPPMPSVLVSSAQPTLPSLPALGKGKPPSGLVVRLPTRVQSKRWSGPHSPTRASAKTSLLGGTSMRGAFIDDEVVTARVANADTDDEELMRELKQVRANYYQPRRPERRLRERALSNELVVGGRTIINAARL